jgi:hypothetical protein
MTDLLSPSDLVKPYLDKSFSKQNAIPLHIPVTCGIYVRNDDPLTSGDYRNSKRCKEVLREIQKFSESSLGQYDPVGTNLPIVRSVERDRESIRAHNFSSFLLYLYHMKSYPD